jgi:hypothetical protein
MLPPREASDHNEPNGQIEGQTVCEGDGDKGLGRIGMGNRHFLAAALSSCPAHIVRNVVIPDISHKNVNLKSHPRRTDGQEGPQTILIQDTVLPFPSHRWFSS